MQYVVHRRLRCKSLSGAVNLPFGTLCTLNGEIIEKDGKPLFFATSENAHQYLARNDDGSGIERGRLTQEIQSRLRQKPNPKDEAKRLEAWSRIWNDEKLKPYKMREHPDHWLWNHAFFNADIATLQYILKVIEGGA